MKLILLGLMLFVQTTGFIQGTIEHNGLDRSFWLYVPESYNPEEPTPLVIVLHPAGGGVQNMIALTGFHEYAEEIGFIALYPAGYYGYFDYGAGYPSWEGAPNLVDDPGFLSLLYDEVQQRYNIDPDRIYAVGYSNGARMAYRLGCDLPLAGIAGVSATLSDEVTKNCNPEMQPRVLYMHGTRDRVTPWAGKRLYIEDQFISNALSAPDSASFWAEHNGCDPEPAVDALSTSDWTIQVQTYGGCPSEVVFYGIEGGGHEWFYQDDFDTSTVIMDFFFDEE